MLVPEKEGYVSCHSYHTLLEERYAADVMDGTNLSGKKSYLWDKHVNVISMCSYPCSCPVMLHLLHACMNSSWLHGQRRFSAQG